MPERRVFHTNGLSQYFFFFFLNLFFLLGHVARWSNRSGPLLLFNL